ncbi:small ribosomal subunit protein uS5m isoform X2 [Hydra vulgaris]|uniref:Small ribosomal subunit protein uS5m n=1 Tax=Hydra vulgaris TaxID=6087 RepID=A0ABM4CKN6_HYDVU
MSLRIYSGLKLISKCLYSNTKCGHNFSAIDGLCDYVRKPSNWVSKRYYVIGEYDKLWQAVSSGKGKRGGKKRTAAKAIDGEFIKFGKANMQFPGLNAPLPIKDRERSEKKSTFPKSDRIKHAKLDASLRGWSGTSWPGRYAGSPETPNKEPIEDFKSIVIEVKKVSVTRGNGKRKRTSAIVVVGNGKGAIGWAIGKASFAASAIRKAKNKAVNYLHYVPVHADKTIYHSIETKVNSTTIKFERKVPGHGRRCQRIIRAICELAGIENIRCKIVGRTTPLSVVKATFQGLALQETHEELAERTGKNVVEFRPERGNIPVIVATPSEASVLRRIEREAKGDNDDISKYFDPFMNSHRPKTINQIRQS